MAQLRQRGDADPPGPDGHGTERTGLLTYAEAGRQLRVHPRTIRNWCDDGRLQRVELAFRVQRVTAESVERLIASGLVSAG